MYETLASSKDLPTFRTKHLVILISLLFISIMYIITWPVFPNAYRMQGCVDDTETNLELAGLRKVSKTIVAGGSIRSMTVAIPQSEATIVVGTNGATGFELK